MTAEKKTVTKATRRARKTSPKRRASKPAATTPSRKPPSQMPKAPKPEEVKAAALELREIRKTVDKFKKELRLGDDSTADPYLRERLFTDLALNFFYGGEQDSEVFLKEAREQKKVTGKTSAAQSSKRKTRKMTPQAEAREVRRRWRQLHGLDDDSETSQAEAAE